MEAILAEINLKRKEATERNAGSKYQRRGEAKESTVLPVVAEATKQLPESQVKPRLVSEDHTTTNTLIDISLTEIIRRLRSLNEPIRLFAENDAALFRRLKTLSSREERSHAQNDFSLAWKTTSDAIQKNVFDQVASQPSPLIIDYDFTRINQRNYRENADATRVILIAYLSHLLDAWEVYLKARSDDVKSSGSGKMYTTLQNLTKRLTAAHIQSSASLTIFFKVLRANKTPEDVVEMLVEICAALVEKEYIRANDYYLRLSIGNAAWPIGVTSVGMHERASDSKLNCSNKVAHVLNDEGQRKWIQGMLWFGWVIVGVKRLMTFCQTRWPPADKSKAMG